MEDFSQYNGEGTTLRKAQMRLLEMLIEVHNICEKHNITYWIDGGTTLGAVRHGGFIPWDDDIDIALLKKDYHKLVTILKHELPKQFVLQNRGTEKYFHLNYSRVVDTHSFSDYGENRMTNRKKMKHQGLFLDIVYVEKGFFNIKLYIEKFYHTIFYNLTLNNNRLKRIYAHIAWPVILSVVNFLRLIFYLIPTDKYIFGYGISFKRKLRKSELLPVKPILFEGVWVSGPHKVHLYLERYYGKDYMKIPPESQRTQHAEKLEVYE
ncbi:MAG: LicD family protein [Bacteroidales bacterium]